MQIFIDKETEFTFAESPVLPVLEKVMGIRYSRHSCLYGNFNNGTLVDCERKMRDILSRKPIKTAVEIGTFRGVGAAMLAQYAEEVYTIDITQTYEPQILWITTKCRDKIKQVVIRDEFEKVILLKELDFDFAFVDGDHTYEGVKWDWENTAKCGRVLFHDYFNEEHTIDGKKGSPAIGVKKLVDGLPQNEVVINEPFAYWEKNGHD